MKTTQIVILFVLFTFIGWLVLSTATTNKQVQENINRLNMVSEYLLYCEYNPDECTLSVNNQ